MSELIETETFVVVVAEGSFAAASERLGISSSYASKLVKRLEERLGVRLLNRTTRSLTLTDAGTAYHEICAEGLGLIARARDNVAALQTKPRGVLRVTFPTTLGLTWLASWIADFGRSNPELRMDVVYLDRAVDLVSEGFDVAVRAGVLPDSSLIARRLAMGRRIVVASPHYLERHSPPSDPAQLNQHECLLYSNRAYPGRWQFESELGTRSVDVSGPMVANSGDALLHAAKRGLGIAYLPDFHVAPALAQGEVVQLLEGWSSPVPIHALYASTRHVPAKTRVFVDRLAEHLEHPPWA